MGRVGENGCRCPGLEVSFLKSGSPGLQRLIDISGTPTIPPITEHLSTEALSGEALNMVLNVLLNQETVLGPSMAEEENGGSEAPRDFLARVEPGREPRSPQAPNCPIARAPPPFRPAVRWWRLDWKLSSECFQKWLVVVILGTWGCSWDLSVQNIFHETAPGPEALSPGFPPSPVLGSAPGALRQSDPPPQEPSWAEALSPWLVVCGFTASCGRIKALIASRSGSTFHLLQIRAA